MENMVEYGYLIDQQDNIVYMTGIQSFDGLLRIESRTWINPIYRKRLWNPPDNYDMVIQQYNNHKHNSFFFKSRKRSPAGHLRSQKLNKFFNDWILYPKPIELYWKDNIQWIMYKGNENEIEKILYKA